MPTRVLALGFLVAFVNGVVLALGIGWVGASRAFTLGPEVLFADNPGAVVVSSFVALGMAAAFSFRLASPRDGAVLLLAVAAFDLAAAVATTVLIPELELIHVARAFATVSTFGVQLLAVAVGVLLGYGLGHRGRAG